VNIILFGPPGAGKGTQAKYLVKKFNCFQISTGEMLRREIQNNSEIGKKIVDNMNEGKFVNDEIVNKIIKEIVFDPQKKDKLIFDGYPRSISQAKNLDILLDNTNQKIDYIFFLNVSRKVILNRIEKRKILEKRSDDDVNTIIKRYDKYMEATSPVLDFYSKNTNFYEIDGNLKIDDITAKINDFIKF
tara:strand:- start:331 stop:894 length:564 start_codon:yes stop_codon:yes gene_type:complete